MSPFEPSRHKDAEGFEGSWSRTMSDLRDRLERRSERFELPRLELDTGRRTMKAIVVMDQAAGTAGMTLVEWPEPQER